MSNSTVLVSRDSNTVVLTLNRSEKLNALNAEMFSALGECLNRLARDGSIRALILTGASEAFCAGTDIVELDGSDKEKGGELSRRGQILCDQVESFPAPVIAAVNG